MPVELAELVLDSVLSVIERDEDGLGDFHVFEIIRIAVDVYRCVIFYFVSLFLFY